MTLPREEKLKACPFCGETPTTIWKYGSETKDSVRRDLWAVRHVCSGKNGHGYTEAEALSAWNRRPEVEKASVAESGSALHGRATDDGGKLEGARVVQDDLEAAAKAAHDEGYANGFADARWDGEAAWDRDQLTEDMDAENVRDSWYDGSLYAAREAIENALAASSADPKDQELRWAAERCAAVANLIQRPPSDDILLERSVAEQHALDLRAILAALSPVPSVDGMELVGDFERRASACSALAGNAFSATDRERLVGKASAYQHAAELVRSMLSHGGGNG